MPIYIYKLLVLNLIPSLATSSTNSPPHHLTQNNKDLIINDNYPICCATSCLSPRIPIFPKTNSPRELSQFKQQSPRRASKGNIDTLKPLAREISFRGARGLLSVFHPIEFTGTALCRDKSVTVLAASNDPWSYPTKLVSGQYPW